MKRKRSNGSKGIAGIYIFDKKLGRVVKVSNEIPRVASKSGARSPDAPGDAGPCGREECSGGACAGPDFGDE